VASGIERQKRDESCTSQKNSRNNDVHGYSSSNFAMAPWIRTAAPGRDHTSDDDVSREHDKPNA
jgi:hypothetical protein